MAYPPSTLATNKADNTPSTSDHAQHHNDLAAAINDIVAELGSNPSGSDATVTGRLSTLETTVSGISGGTDAETVRDLIGTTLVAGDNVTIDVDDAGNEVTINASLDAGTGNGGYGPNWVAAADAPAALRTAVTAAGGTVIGSVGTNAATAINSKLSSYKHVMLSEGTFSVSGTITVPQGRTLQGSGNPATEIRAISGITSRILYATADKITICDLFVNGNGQGSNVVGIEVNVSSNSGFFSQQTNEACTVLHDIQIDGNTGDGVVMSGYYNRDSKLYNIDVHNSGGDGFYITCPDGTLSQCVAGTPGGHGFIFDGAANWRAVNCKAWYSDGCGWIIGASTATARIGLIGCEAQDNEQAGFRILRSNAPMLTGCVADSNSNTSGNAGVYSGFEVYCTGSSATGAYVGGGAVLSGCIAYDKSEGGRGYRQAYGFRFGQGLRYATAMGCGTGDNDAHHNATGGVLFNTGSDQTHSSNLIAINSHGSRVLSF